MTKELDFSDGIDNVKYQDANSSLNLSLSENGVPFDLSRLDNLQMRIGNNNGYLIEKQIDLSNVENATSGNITVKLDGDIMNKLIPDDYQLELWGQLNPVQYIPDTNSVNVVIDENGLDDIQTIFPSDSTLLFTVNDNVNETPYDAINTYAIDDIIDSIKQWREATINNLNADISSRLQNEIVTWQGSISEKLQQNLLDNLANDEGHMREHLSDSLAKSFNDLIDAGFVDIKNKFEQYKVDTTNDVTRNITNQMIQNVSDKFTQENSSIRNDLTNMVKETLHTDIMDELHQMQINGSIAVSKADLDKAINQVNQSINQLHNDIDNDIVIKMSNISKIVNDLQNNSMTIRGWIQAGQDLNKLPRQNGVWILGGIDASKLKGYPMNLLSYDKGYVWGYITQVGSNWIKQELVNVTTNVYGAIAYRLYENQWNDWYLVANNRDLDNLHSTVKGDINSSINSLRNDINTATDTKIHNLNDSVNQSIEMAKTDSSVNLSMAKDDLTNKDNDLQEQIINRVGQGEYQNKVQDFQNQINNLSNNALKWTEDLPSNTDLNEVKQQGIYWFHGFIPKNAPKSDNNVGTLITTVTGDCVTQFISYISVNEVYFRILNKSGWVQEWNRISTEKDLDNLNKVLNQKYDDLKNQINSISDNTLMKRGYVFSAENNQNLLDVYYQDDGYFKIENVEYQPIGHIQNGIIEKRSIDYSNMWVIVYDISNSKTWFNTYNSGWKGWKELLNVDDFQSIINQTKSDLTRKDNDLQNQINSKSNDLQNQLNNTLSWKGVIHSEADLNDIHYTSIYGFETHNLPKSFPDLNKVGVQDYGTWGTVETVMSNTNFGIQKVYATTANKNNVIAYRMYCNEWYDWSYSISEKDLEDVKYDLQNQINARVNNDIFYGKVNDLQNQITNNYNNSLTFRGEIEEGADLNDLVNSPDGYYESWNKNVKNVPVSFTSWFVVKIINRAGITYMEFINNSSDRYYRIAGGYPKGWGQWNHIANFSDVETMVNQARTDLTNNVNGRVDWNTYNGKVNDLQQQVWNRVSNDTFNNKANDLQNQINDRVGRGEYGGKVGDLQNQINNKPNIGDTLSFKGEPQNANLSEVTQTGIYVLNGRTYNDYPSQAHQVWGHMFVIGILGMTTQFVISNRGRILVRMMSTSAVSGSWVELGK